MTGYAYSTLVSLDTHNRHPVVDTRCSREIGTTTTVNRSRNTEIAEALLGDYTWAFLLTYPDVKYDAVTGEPHDPRTVHQFMADDGADARQVFDDTFAPDGWVWVGTCDLTSRASIDNLLTIVAEMWA